MYSHVLKISILNLLTLLCPQKYLIFVLIGLLGSVRFEKKLRLRIIH